MSTRGVKPSFFIIMSNLRNRIIGTETEFGLIMPDFGGIYSEKLQSALPKNIVGAQEFLSNGARFYNDFNNQLEYASPECYGVVEAVHAEIAGEKVVYDTLRKLADKEEIGNFHLYKRVIDDRSTTWGYHENYLVDRKAFTSWELRSLMLGHLATRNIFVGAGWWLGNHEDVAYVVPAQKSQTVEVDASLTTTHDKPLLNLRDEPHTMAEEWARLHITSGDPNISPWATWLKLGSTSLVLRLSEEDFAPDVLKRFVKPAETCHMVGLDAEIANIYSLTNGDSISAMDMQEWLIELCEQMAEEIDIPKEEVEVLRAWRKALDDIRRDPENLMYKSDWITRRRLLGGFAARHAVTDPYSRELSQVDQTWDMIHPTIGVGVRHRERMAFPSFDLTRVAKYTTHPPAHTRAHARAEIIRNMPKKARNHASVDWEHVEFGGKEYHLLDPYNSSIPAL